MALVAQEHRNSWRQLLRANVWTGYGSYLAVSFGSGFLLRLVLQSHQEDYVGFSLWLLLVSLAGAGYGFVRARQDRSEGTIQRPVSRIENVLASVLAISATIIIVATDNTSARMLGRYTVALLVAVLAVVDSVARHRRTRVGRR